MKCGSQIAVAVVGGYFLGRSRKTRLAALLALLAAGGKIPIDQRELLRKTPLGAPLDKLTGDLRSQIVDAGMNVAKRAASNRIDSFSDRLQERADVLRTPQRKGGAGEEDEEPQERPRRKSREPAREEPARRGRSSRQEPEEEAPDEYDDYDDDYEDEYDDEGPYEEDEYEEDEPEPEERRRPSRPEPRRRAPRSEERPRRGRTTR